MSSPPQDIACGHFISVRFDIDNQRVWWPSVVTHISIRGSARRNTLKVYAHLLYHAFKTHSADYKEEKGQVQFLSDHLLIILDEDGHPISEASWRYSFDVPAIDDQRTLHCTETAQPLCSTPMAMYQLSLPARVHIGNTQAQDIPSPVISNTHTDRLVNSTPTSDCIFTDQQVSQLTSAMIKHGHFKMIERRLCFLEQNSDNIHQQALRNALLESIDRLKFTVRRKLLDYMQRPLQINRPRTKSKYSNIFQPYTIKLSFDCDYKLFTYIVSDIKTNDVNSTEVLFHPSSLHDHIPSSSTGPLHVIFRSFKQLAKWFHVQDEQDLRRLLFRYSKSSASTAVGILGSTIYDPHNEFDGIDVFLGKSSSTHSELPTDTTRLDTHHDVSFSLQSKEWDSANNNFLYKFKKVPKLPAISASSTFSLISNNYFQLVWEVVPMHSRSIWSADSTFSRSTILGTLTMILPSAEFFGREAVGQVAATEFFEDH